MRVEGHDGVIKCRLRGTYTAHASERVAAARRKSCGKRRHDESGAARWADDGADDGGRGWLIRAGCRRRGE